MKVKNLLIILLSILLINCSKEDDSKQVNPKLSSENQITSFKIPGNGEAYNGVIDQSNKTIKVIVSNIDLSIPITPIIEISAKATITPSPSNSQNFNESVQYTVTAQNGEKAVYNVTVNSSDNEITSFSIKPNETTFYGVINESNKTIIIETSGLELNSTLIPEIEYSPSATISPAPSSAQDFSQDIQYTLTAQNGEEVIYTVSTQNTILTNDKKILSFQFKFGSKIYDGIIDHNNLTVFIETDRFIYNLKPLITISENASISPDPNEPQNFYREVEYTVTAEDNTTNTYTVTTKAYEMHDVQPTKFYSNGIGVLNGNGLDLTVPNSSLVIENDTNSYTLNIIESYVTVQPFGNVETRHKFSFPENVTTANNYKVKYKINGETKVTSTFSVDVLAEDVPVIHSSNNSTYSYLDTLILYGENLVPGFLIYAVNGSAYRFDENFITVNSDRTELRLQLTNYMMFPSYYGIQEDFATQISIDYLSRRGNSIIVDFN